MEEDKCVPYVTSVERLAKEEGLKEGLKEGRAEGRVEGLRKSLQTVLSSRFGSVPESIVTRLQALQSEATFDELVGKAATAGSLAEFETGLGD
jgi:flagellar biosynthesis/type III secretory pathway protein FliH